MKLPRTTLEQTNNVARPVLIQAFHPKLSELHLIAMVLQANRAALRHTGQFSGIDDTLAVEINGHPVAFERNQKGVPLAEPPIGVFDRDAGAADLLRHFLIGAIAVDFAGAEFLAPDIGLALQRAAKQ